MTLIVAGAIVHGLGDRCLAIRRSGLLAVEIREFGVSVAVFHPVPDPVISAVYNL